MLYWSPSLHPHPWPAAAAPAPPAQPCLLTFEADAFYVMGRGYLDFTRLHRLHKSGAYFVTRAKGGMNARRVHSNPVDRGTGLICDQFVN
jgi:hypothetical protein